MKRVVLLNCLASMMLLALAVPSQAEPAPAAGADEIKGSLLIESPVNIQGPAEDKLREARVGDLIVLQIRYPIVPPMPQGVSVSSEGQAIEMVTAAHSTSEAAILSREPQTNGKIGIGYVQLLVRAKKAGQQRMTANVKLSDGSVKKVPFSFDVKPGSR